MFSNAATLAAAAFAITANAHMFISSPQPIPGSAPKDPLDASGSNFPCHGVSLPTSGGEQMPAGSSQLLAWNLGGGYNTAVHGGGSCQMSITYETDPDKVKDPKNWYVIYSIEGGCPSNTAGNLDGSYIGPSGSYTGAVDCTDPKTNGVDCVNQFNFTIPKGVRNGHGIIGWTWFNTIGNREIYMNCVNAQFSGGDGSEMSEFPTMFVANLASVDTCPTTEETNVKFPYPGKYVTTKLPSGEAAKTASSYPIVAPSGAGCAGDGAPAGGNGAAPTYGGKPPPDHAGASPTAGGNSPSAAPSAPASSAGGSMVTVTTMQTVTSSAAEVSSVPASGGLPSSPAAPSSAPAAASSGYTPSTSGGSSSGSCADGAVPCPNPGAVVCVGSSQFGLCNINNCAVPQQLAEGTHCTDGEIRKRDHIRRHIARHEARHHGHVL